MGRLRRGNMYQVETLVQDRQEFRTPEWLVPYLLPAARGEWLSAVLEAARALEVAGLPREALRVVVMEFQHDPGYATFFGSQRASTWYGEHRRVDQGAPTEAIAVNEIAFVEAMAAALKGAVPSTADRSAVAWVVLDPSRVFEDEMPSLWASIPLAVRNGNGATLRRYRVTGTVWQAEGLVVGAPVLEEEREIGDQLEIFIRERADVAYTAVRAEAPEHQATLWAAVGDALEARQAVENLGDRVFHAKYGLGSVAQSGALGLLESVVSRPMAGTDLARLAQKAVSCMIHLARQRVWDDCPAELPDSEKRGRMDAAGTAEESRLADRLIELVAN